MEFTYTQKRMHESFAQRSVVTGTSGMVASSQHLATLAGYKILAGGGNAVDAAVAMLATLNVVEPHSVGIGGDAFALIYLHNEGRLLGMNASGRAPYRATIPWFREKGMTAMPDRGILTVTVPGALHGWAEAVKRYGTQKLGVLFEDAIYYAENGFAVTEVIAGEWKDAEALLQSQESASKCYLIDGKAPRPGQVFRNADLAKTLKIISREGIEAFYQGEIGEAIVEFSDKQAGLLTLNDLKDHATTWVEPISSTYQGYTIHELPPNGQGIIALEMLNILEGYDIASLRHNSPDYLHLLIEAKKIAFSDRDRFVADPEFENIPIDTLLSKDYARRRGEKIDLQKAMPIPAPLGYNGKSDTVYVTAVDKDRNAASFISSIYMPFGSGLVVDGTGIVLQNRGNLFSLDSNHFNSLEPHKRPLHTIIPGMVFKDGTFLMSFGVMGGDMQPQGHAQLLINLIDFKMNLQEALDAPRIRHLGGLDIYIEDGIPGKTVAELEKRGHRIARDLPPVNQVGGGQAIYHDNTQDILLGASDRRKDGCAIGY